MSKSIDKSIKILNKKEKKLLNSVKKENPLKNQIYEKIPDTLTSALETAFTKAFKVVF